MKKLQNSATAVTACKNVVLITTPSIVVELTGASSFAHMPHRDAAYGLRDRDSIALLLPAPSKHTYHAEAGSEERKGGRERGTGDDREAQFRCT